MLAVHVTHEAARKVGGIGAVLNGLIPARAYDRVFDRTVLVGPLFDPAGPAASRLTNRSRVLYSSLDGLDETGLAPLLAPIEQRHGINLVVGRREIHSSLDPNRTATADVVLVGVGSMPAGPADGFKRLLWESFGLDSLPHHDWDYEQYLRLAVPYLDIIEALFPGEEAVHFGHEYMGLPALLSVELARRRGRRAGDRTFFYAHEVAPARPLAENHPGHEVAFDNLVRLGLAEGRTLEDDFGPQAHNYRAGLVRTARHLDGILAVSDNVRDQLLYFDPAIDPDKIKVVYNGFNFTPIDFATKETGRRLVADYCETLLNFRPDLIFTHMTRLVVSKGLWRDLKLLHHVDQELARRGLKGFYLLLSTLIGPGRPAEEILRMERDYGWPVFHRKGWPDLEGGEQSLYDYLTLFNARSRAVKGVFLNQFGFSPEITGRRTPEGAGLLDLRAASDAELGMSVYEPFGIAQLETYAYGGIPVVSRACGCSYLLEEKAPAGTYLILDFARPGNEAEAGMDNRPTLLSMSLAQREAVEEAVVAAAAADLVGLIEPGRRRANFEVMREAAAGMSWEVIAERVVSGVLSP